MSKTVVFLASVILFVSAFGHAEQNEFRDIYADTWVATDDLGRTMPGQADVGPLKDDQRRVVSIFYITWHDDGKADWPAPYGADVTKILEEHPEARFDRHHPAWYEMPSYHWAEPEDGYFLSKDEYVIRKDMSMLADAGVDVLIMDVTNAVRYWDEWDVVFPVMQQMKAEGNKVPQFCFWAFNGPSITVVQDLYERIYKEEKYKDLWYHWDGKPLLLCNMYPEVDATPNKPVNENLLYDSQATTDTTHAHYGDPRYTTKILEDYPKEIKEFFTMRMMWWGYYEWGRGRFIGTEGNWSFGYDMGDERVRNLDPSELVSTWEGKPEQVAVTPAQHASSGIGKCWTREHGQPYLDEYDLPLPMNVPWLGETVDNPEAYGIYFQDRWDEALAVDPQMVYLNDWNEWTAGMYPPFDGSETTPFLGRESNFIFVDQYNSEFNRGIQPMKGGYTDNYYMQMAQNIRRYKGVRAIPELDGFDLMTIDGDFSDWNAVEVEYRDTIGDTAHRDYPGYAGLHYTDDSGRNDIVTAKVAFDQDDVFFYVETKDTMTPSTDPMWMLLLIDADQNSETGWYGYDFLINRNVVNENVTTLMCYKQTDQMGAWVEEDWLPYLVSGNQLEISIPRSKLGLLGDQVSFDFHWVDNPKNLQDLISLCTHGDSAPNRRFNYRCIWKQ